ncbi:MAG: germination protein YpeB [Oscillospiraceae bacterium]
MKKSTAITTISILAALTLAAGTFGIMSSVKATNNERRVATSYQRGFAELVSEVSAMDSALQKSCLVTSSSIGGAVCTEIFGKAQTAQMALEVLPLGGIDLERTSGFIGRVGDYAFSLSQKAARGQAFSPEERQNLRALADASALLAQNLKSVQSDIGSGLISIAELEGKMDSLDKREGEFLPKTLGDSLSMAETEFPEIPALIYDGPFSEHLKGVEPRLLQDKPEVDLAEGRRAAAQFLGLGAEKVFPEGEIAGDIPSFAFGAELSGEPISVRVSKKGGVVYSALGSRLVERRELSPKEALDAAKKFLEHRGYSGMVESYYLISNNILTANFAWVQEGIVCYSDLVKVSIAMDDGSLQGFEAQGYLMAHCQRQLPQIAVSPEAAKERVAPELEVLGVRTALIPNAGNKEQLCHEFECKDANDSRYIIYVNALTGEQEKILILLQDENGTLTI